VTGIAATSLIVFAPVKSGAADRLPADLASLDGNGGSPFSRIGGTHFARLVFVPALTGVEDEPLEGEGSFLMLCADFDPELHEWAEGLCDRAGPGLAAVLSCWEGFPGLDDTGEVEGFLRRHRVHAGFTVAGYRRATVAEIREALRLRSALRALALRRQSEKLGASALREAWRQLVMP
jgi:hypothetical protein